MKSAQEVEVAHAFDAEPLVLRWYYEKKAVVYDYRNKLCTYFLDFLVYLKGGVTLHLEIKPQGHRPTKQDKLKWEEAREVFGERFLVVESLEEGFAMRWIEEHQETD